MTRDVQLQPMSEKDFEIWRKNSLEDYANDLAKSGLVDKEKSKEAAKKEFDKLLKDGYHTENNDFFYIVDKEDGTKVGTFWILYREDQNPKQYFIADIMIFEDYRRQGYGRATMLQCEDLAKANGAKKLRLHVFGFNTPAVSLYTQLDYQPISIIMEKVIG
jgi:GNAT superfamily N-acetyltransferase